MWGESLEAPEGRQLLLCPVTGCEETEAYEEMRGGFRAVTANSILSRALWPAGAARMLRRGTAALGRASFLIYRPTHTSYIYKCVCGD